jgi:cytochrome c553
LKEAAAGFVPFPIVAKHYNCRALKNTTPSSAPARIVVTFRRRWCGGLIWLALGLAPLLAVAAVSTDRAGIEFFEKHVRPVLADHCYNCHSPGAEKGVKGGLLLDTRDGLLKGGDNGPAIVAGDPEKSLLIKAVRYHDENLQMPPKGKKLSDQQIEDLVAWVKMGAPDPRTGAAQGVKSKTQSRDHWAFKPVKEPPPPAIKNRKLVQTPVDQFVLAKLEAKGLSLSPRADKRTLIRRVSYDLTGLPPTPEETLAFDADKAPDAFARLVDRLLASPRYGERWGRYWLDIARYADTKGYVFEEERRYPYSYTYRDWVVRAFNEDLPYDQFLIQQIAADLLPLGDDKRPLAALGFLTLGRRFLNNQPDIIDDRIDVVTRGTMGLTVACARCHDHKFDPVPTKDYYSLYGVFASSHEPSEQPLLGSASMQKEYPEYLAERKRRQRSRTREPAL